MNIFKRKQDISIPITAPSGYKAWLLTGPSASRWEAGSVRGGALYVHEATGIVTADPDKLDEWLRTR